MNDIKELLVHTADGAYIIDEQQHIVFWNDAAQRLLGYRAEEVIGQSCFKVITGRDETGCPICRRNCIPFVDSGRGEGVSNFDVLVHTKNGHARWINVSILAAPRDKENPGANAAPGVMIHLFRDVSAKKQAETFALQVAIQARQLRLSNPQPDGSREVHSTLDELTSREIEVLRFLVQGVDTPVIAAELFITEVTVRNHVQRILQKLGVHSRLEAVAYARKCDFS